jgi:integrase
MEWHVQVIAVRGRLRLLVKDEDGTWRQRALGLADTPENRAVAERRCREVDREMHALERATGGEGGTLTVQRWGKKWLLARDNRDQRNDESRLRTHVFPAIGDLPLAGVEPRHLAALAKEWQALAPRTRRNIYSVVKAMFRDAAIEGLIRREADPCILTHRQLGKIRDAPTFLRREARFSREELEVLVGDERVPQDRRVWYALLGIGMLRTGEAAGLRWSKIEPAAPLSRIVIDASYNGATKTDTARHVPAHPTLAGILAEWRLAGWARAFGRAPGPDDLVVPVTPEPPRKGRRVAPGSMRDCHWARKRLMIDLAKLELRHRRSHDLRRTGISLAQDDGADRSLLRWATHAPPREVFDGYTTLEWDTLCREVGRMRVARRQTGELLSVNGHARTPNGEGR